MHFTSSPLHLRPAICFSPVPYLKSTLFNKRVMCLMGSCAESWRDFASSGIGLRGLGIRGLL